MWQEFITFLYLTTIMNDNKMVTKSNFDVAKDYDFQNDMKT